MYGPTMLEICNSGDRLPIVEKNSFGLLDGVLARNMVARLVVGQSSLRRSSLDHVILLLKTILHGVAFDEVLLQHNVLYNISVLGNCVILFR